MGWATNPERRKRKFAMQGGRCYWCNGQMTLNFKRGTDGQPNVPRNYATFEHIHRRRDGGAGRPNNIVLACKWCNNRREDGQPGHYNPPKPENLAAWTASTDTLRGKLATGTYTPQELGEIYKRG